MCSHKRRTPKGPRQPNFQPNKVKTDIDDANGNAYGSEKIELREGLKVRLVKAEDGNEGTTAAD